MAEVDDDEPVPLDETLEGTSLTINRARAGVVEYLTAGGFTGDILERARLVVSELATNAIQASPGLPYRVRASAGPGGVRITVANRAAPDALPPSDQWGPAEPLAERGRGLAIVESLSASVEHEAVDEWLVITASLHRSPPPSSR